MKRTIAIAAMVAVAALGTAFTGYNYHVKNHHATCTGSRYCHACKNCKYCNHCAKQGGTCGVCR
jgi:hypothetical protein